MNNFDDILQVNTPENVAFGYEVAGIGSRFLAALVDTTLLVVIQIGFILLGVLFMVGSGFHMTDNIPIWFSALVGMVSFLFFWGYYIYFEVQWNGQSPGKRWARLRVIRTDGLPITMGEAVIRNLVRVVDFLPVAYGVGVVTMFIQPQARRLGDLAAGTLVIHDRQTATLHEMTQAAQARRPLANEFAEGAQEPLLPSIFPVEQLRPQDIQLAENFLQRRQELSNRGSLAVQIVQRLYRQMGMEYSEMSTAQAEDTLVSLVKAYRQIM
jgi:uncharacterized RDD family membrane protein YckC